MKKNVGNLDAHIRLFMGFSLLGMGVIRSSRFTVGLGAMKIATGISRFCPIMHVLKLSTVRHDEHLKDLLKKVPEYADHLVEDLGLE